MKITHEKKTSANFDQIKVTWFQIHTLFPKETFKTTGDFDYM